MSIVQLPKIPFLKQRYNELLIRNELNLITWATKN